MLRINRWLTLVLLVALIFSDCQLAHASPAPQEYTFALARYNVDGSLDPTFDGDGKVLTDFASATSEVAYALVIDGREHIVVAGSAFIP